MGYYGNALTNFYLSCGYFVTHKYVAKHVCYSFRLATSSKEGAVKTDVKPTTSILIP